MIENSHPIIIISGPSSVGKTTLSLVLFEKFPLLRRAVTVTTRRKRSGAREDKILHHVTKNEFKKMIANNEFIEWAEVHGNYYGTHKQALEQALQTNPVLLNIDYQGATQIKKHFTNIFTIFIKPHDFSILKKRMLARGKLLTPEQLALRLKNAVVEMKQSSKYDFVTINKDGELNETIDKLSSIFSDILNS